MSWSVQYVAKGKAAAKALAQRANLPLPVQLLVSDAINFVRGDAEQLISVEGHGHQADGQSYDVTSIALTVKPLSVSTV